MSKAAAAEKTPELPMGASPPPTSASRRKASKEVAVASPAAVAPLPPQPSLLAIVKEAATNPAVDVGKMRELLAMAREEEMRQAERDAFSALMAMQAERPRIAKDRMGDSDKYRYATLERVAAELDPLISKHGFAISYGQPEPRIDGHYCISATLMHGHSGWKKEYFIDMPVGAHKSPTGKELMSPSQGVGVVISYARRYLKLMIFDVTIAGEDIDGALPKDVTPINAKQLDALQKAIAFKEVNVPAFLQKFGAASLETFPRGHYDKAMSLIAQKDAPAKDTPENE